MPDRQPPPLVPNPGYQTKDWSGHEVYQCDWCPFDTMDADIMRQHQAGYHRAGVQTANSQKEMTDE